MIPVPVVSILQIPPGLSAREHLFLSAVLTETAARLGSSELLEVDEVEEEEDVLGFRCSRTESILESKRNNTLKLAL
jgi:hypothetical protein